MEGQGDKKKLKIETAINQQNAKYGIMCTKKILNEDSKIYFKNSFKLQLTKRLRRRKRLTTS